MGEETVVAADGVVGSLTEQEQAELALLRQKCAGLISDIGQGELHKARLLGQIGQLESKAEQIMRGAAERLGIPAGTTWQLLPNGTIRIQA